jgi:protein TonB
MSLVLQRRGYASRIGEIALWGSAAILVLTVHIAAAAILMREEPEELADNGPQAAIMIELAPEPEAAIPEEEQIATDAEDQQLVETQQTEPVEEVEPVEEPPAVEPPPEVAEETPEPPPEPMIETPLPEETPPPPEIVETPPPEPVDPIEEKVTAALENVEVPLPVTRPPPPKPVQKVEKPRRQPQAQKEKAQAKVQAQPSERTAAAQTSSGAVASTMSPSTWMTRVRTKIARNARRCPSSQKGIVTVSFNFDSSGNIGRVSVARSSGDTRIDDYVVSAVRRASPVPIAPAGVASLITQSVECK